jgi:Flp pilus assembly secretin CpaC
MRSLIVAALTLLASPALAQSVELAIDEARSVRLATPITGVVVGNAGVADVIVHDANLLFVLGKSVGRTSVIAVDARGRTVYSGVIDVTAGENPDLVVVQRGNASTSAYQCSQRCVGVVSSFATQDANGAAAGNASARSGFARGGGGN